MCGWGHVKLYCRDNCKFHGKNPHDSITFGNCLPCAKNAKAAKKKGVDLRANFGKGYTFLGNPWVHQPYGKDPWDQLQDTVRRRECDECTQEMKEAVAKAIAQVNAAEHEQPPAAQVGHGASESGSGDHQKSLLPTRIHWERAMAVRILGADPRADSRTRLRLRLRLRKITAQPWLATVTTTTTNTATTGATQVMEFRGTLFMALWLRGSTLLRGRLIPVVTITRLRFHRARFPLTRLHPTRFIRQRVHHMATRR